jgi:putative tricarboxylic transport membrane protein
MHNRHSRLPGELTFMVLVVLFSAFMLWAAYGISRFQSAAAPGVFPMVCALAMLVTGGMNLIKTARARLRFEDGETWAQQLVRKVVPLQLVLFALLILAYMLLMEVLGFLVASYLFLVLAMSLLGSRRVGLNLLVSLLVLAAIFVVFRTAFSVVLPAGSLVGPYLPGVLR